MKLSTHELIAFFMAIKRHSEINGTAFLDRECRHFIYEKPVKIGVRCVELIGSI